MTIDSSVLHNDEKIIFALRELYSSYGYAPYKMSKFEEYDLYARNKDFLVSDNVITFTDTNGRLMALKPDVTLSIIKNSRDVGDGVQKLFYNENVYRVAKGTNSFREIMQTGLECFGSMTDESVCEVIALAVKSMLLMSDRCVLELSNLSLIESAIDSLNIPGEKRKVILSAIENKNLHEIDAICTECKVSDEKISKLKSILGVHDDIPSVLSRLHELFDFAEANDSLEHFESVLTLLSGLEESKKIVVDFSVIGDSNYYNGILFKGFIDKIPVAVLSGGQYDNLMQKMNRTSKAAGFAVYMDSLERIDFDCSGEKTQSGNDGYLNVALPKGRLGEKVYAMFAKAGFECPSVLEPNRKLIFENSETKVRYFWVKPSDVAIYVEHQAADVGVVGKDILLEYEPEVYELLDLKTGKCRMAVAAPKGFTDDGTRTLHVATKFSNIANSFYRSIGRDIDIIHLNGSIEIAPILKLSDVIVDIVETGETLRENDLEVIEEIVPISARLIANKASFKFKKPLIEKVMTGLAKAVEEKK